MCTIALWGVYYFLSISIYITVATYVLVLLYLHNHGKYPTNIIYYLVVSYIQPPANNIFVHGLVQY